VARRDTSFQRASRAVLATVAGVLIRALGATWRVRIEGKSPFTSTERPLLGALWHRSVFLAAHHFRDRHDVVMVSSSRDGDWIEALLARLGYAPSPRGSSSRGGAGALRQQIRVARETGAAALLCDGPRGPAGAAKPGVLLLARACRAPLWPVAFSARPALRFGSWDRMVLPLPFARVLCAYGEPIHVPRDADAATQEALRVLLDASLNGLTAGLDRRLGLTAPEVPSGA
jgi:lysophospholipid acyltransferase (LPLAT)-like uncharacterized protein